MYKNALKGGIRTAKQAWKFRNGDYPKISLNNLISKYLAA